MAETTRLVGRDSEFARLLTLLDEATTGKPVVALVSGDAGVGKTRLLNELGARAAERGFVVLTGHCAELGDSVPYLPLADALREAGVAGAGSQAGRVAGVAGAGSQVGRVAGVRGGQPPAPEAATPQSTLIQQAVASRPALARLLPDLPVGMPTAGSTEPGVTHQVLFGAVLGFLGELADSAPVLLILEDLHWADGSTRDLVTFLSRALHREHVGVMASYRTDDLHRRHPLRPVLTELLRLPNVTHVELGPLGDSAMAELLTERAGRSLDATSLQALIARAEGNAFYAEELLADAALPGVGGAQMLPRGLSELLLARVERLSPAAQQVLRAAAVTGRLVDDELVAEVSGLAEPDYEAAIREALSAQLLVLEPGRGLSFRHALLREAVYADLLPGERTRLHSRLAELLADERRLEHVPGTAAELARHSLLSHDIASAFAASVRAAAEAQRMSAPGDACKHFELALSLWERVAEPEKAAGMSRGELAYSCALTAADAGDVPRAVHQLRRLLGYIGDDPDRRLYSRASERLGYLLLDLNEDEAAEQAARAAVDALAERPQTWERARALATHARTLLTADDPATPRAQAQAAIEAARATGADGTEADALVTLGLVSEREGRLSEAVDLLSRADAIGWSPGHVRVKLRASFLLGTIQLERGELAAAAATAHAAVERAAAVGLLLAPYGLDVQYLHYLAHYNQGYWDHASEIADGFPARVTTIAEARLSAMALFVAVGRGMTAAVAERRRWLEPFLAQDQLTAYIARGLLAEHAFWSGDLAAALAGSAGTIEASRAYYGGEYGPAAVRAAATGLAVIADEARAARTGGSAAKSETLVAEAARLLDVAQAGAAFRQQPNFVLGIDGRGWLARAQAEYRRAAGDNDPASWRVVLDTFGPDFGYEAARSRWRLAEALAEVGRRDEARREWRLAMQDAERLKARPLLAALEELGRRARLDSPGAAPAGGLAGLTAREHEVLELVASGLSNAEIAAKLFISAKTASVHVSNILAKLGAANRTEAAAIARARGLGGRPA